MGALTIKSYAFEYSLWELEKDRSYKTKTFFPEILTFYYEKRKKNRVSGNESEKQKKILFYNLLNIHKIKAKIVYNDSLNANNLDIISYLILENLDNAEKIEKKLQYIKKKLLLTKKTKTTLKIYYDSQKEQSLYEKMEILEEKQVPRICLHFSILPSKLLIMNPFEYSFAWLRKNKYYPKRTLSYPELRPR
jgi:hypothetical protein